MLLARFLRVTPEEIVITRNTSEANNIVSSGLDLKAGDEVVIFADNHPSNNTAWTQKAKRFGYTVSVDQPAEPAPGRRLLRGSGDASDHAANARAGLHPSDQHGRRRAAGQRAVPARARTRCPDARRRRVGARLPRCRPQRDAARFLHRKLAQVAVRPEGSRRPLRERTRAGAHSPQHHQRLSRRHRHFADAWKPWGSATSRPSSALARRSPFRRRSAARR